MRALPVVAVALSLALAGSLATAEATTVSPPATAGSSGAPGDPASADVPVAGTFRYHASQRDTNDEVVGVVHAVRRVPGGTAVYYSIGYPAGADPSWTTTQPGASLDGYGPYDLRSVGVVDTANLRYYRPMQAAGHCLCSQTTDLQSTGKAGVLLTGFVVVPELPADVSTVGVSFGFGAEVEDVPVGQGPLTPADDGGSSVTVLGTGWPALPDAATVASVASPEKYVLPLTRSVADIAREVTTKEGPDQVQVDLAADVLFAVDEATLNGAAHARLEKVAQQIADRGTGTVTIVGYTDSTGGTSHNIALSRARAASVLKALKPLVTKKGVTFTSSGKGESDPVADNSTQEGRRLNRRVTISFEIAK